MKEHLLIAKSSDITGETIYFNETEKVFFSLYNEYSLNDILYKLYSSDDNFYPFWNIENLEKAIKKIHEVQ